MKSFKMKSMNNPFKGFDWRSLKKYTSNRAMDDLNHFLEDMPQHVSQSMLIAAGIAWSAAGATGLFVTIQLQTLTELKAELEEEEVIQPIVPTIQRRSVSSSEVSAFAASINDLYPAVAIESQGSNIVMRSNSTGAFAQFREAIGHSLNGGSGWQVSIDRLCVGRECDKFPLQATLKVNKVSVSNPK